MGYAKREFPLVRGCIMDTLFPCLWRFQVKYRNETSQSLVMFWILTASHKTKMTIKGLTCLYDCLVLTAVADQPPAEITAECTTPADCRPSCRSLLWRTLGYTTHQDTHPALHRLLSLVLISTLRFGPKWNLCLLTLHNLPRHHQQLSQVGIDMKMTLHHPPQNMNVSNI